MKREFDRLVFVVAPLALAINTAVAQDPDQRTVDTSKKPQKEALEEIIVTGVVEETSKADATFSINTLNREDMQRLAPVSTADLLQNVPGIFAEGGTAGEAGNNITVRGLPVTGGYRYAPQLIDGLPWYEEPEVQFMNNDVAVRGDLMTERVEVVKGGTGGILYSNGLGATVNHVTRTGGQAFEGAYKVEASDYGLLRNDFYVSGPATDNLTYALGGFYRNSDGIRDTGYTADEGGQLRGNLVFTSDDERTQVQLHALFINDHTAFYQNLPFQVPAFSEPGTPEDPIEIKRDEVWPIGIDFADGTVASPYNRHFRMLGEYGEREIDIADGNHADFDIFTVKFRHELESGWRFNAGVRHTVGTNDFNAMFTGNDSTSAAEFLNARYQNDIVSAAHGQALRGEYDTAKLNGFFQVPEDPSAVFPGISRDDFVNNHALAQSVGAFYLDDGSRVADNTVLNFLLPFITDVEAESTSIDLQVQKSFELMGQHDFTLGVYASEYKNDQVHQASLLVSSMEDRSRLVELYGLDTNGNRVGPSLTYNGAILPGFFGYNSDIEVEGRAVYLHDHWELLDSRLKLDLGVRWQDQESVVARRNRELQAGSDRTPNSVVPGSVEDTTADNEIFLPGALRTHEDTFEGSGWSVGANYSFSDRLAVYGLISNSFRLPSLEDLNEFRVDSSRDEEQVEQIWQYETGVRFYTDTWDTQVALFYNDFSPRENISIYRDFTSSECVVNEDIPDINTCPEVREFYRKGVENLGIEVEATWQPVFAEGLELTGNVVYQQPEIVGANYNVVQELTENGVVIGYEFREIGEDGRTPRRLADFMFNLQMVYDTKPLTGLPFKPYMKYTYFGERYSESRDFDVTLYPAYFHVDAGFIWDFSPNLAAQVHVANLTDEWSFTEGDPLFVDLKGPNGATNRGVARPLFGRTWRASLHYRF
ncbi:TonB-dependent receptor [Microbulbifer rhizosphaerae]|uniref:Outer membrane receptor protein involved in Fe transport n=1 Tax=Microbulbifer rhizosphaerae TaxID=1562603 RepID=A0A7W4WDM6_9GAMM|nr:TonB-dependent receptor [Microbulbifer rhizosphaerae]MBB3062300.1 outer membrane receptor protein involved in Fe transport [Microbulbifer rhizosphaerae]